MLNEAGPVFLAAVDAALGPGILRPAEPADLEEPRGLWHGRAAAVARPRNVAEVAALVRACAAARVGIVPRAGGTGLVGGQVLAGGAMPLLLSVERLDRVREVDAASDVLVAEAGVTLAGVQEAAEAAGRLFPLAIASQGTARIGGNLATNAGGLQVLRYGNARDLCLGIEAVMADGAVFHGLRALRKDNTGYDLRHLLIGSEGTLGIVTAASLRLVPRPAELATAWIAVPSPAAALVLFARLRDRADGRLSAFELIDRAGLDLLALSHPQVRAPLMDSRWFVLAELGGESVAAPLEAALAAALDAGEATDAVLAASEAQRRAIWAVRETIPEANRRRGPVASHDISLPLARVPDYIAAAGPAVAALAPDIVVNCFGHLGDGNLHYNLFPAPGRNRAEYAERRDALIRCVHDLAHALGGSFSAEHGIGRAKTADLLRYGDPAKLAAMRAIKRALDPLGILNPGAVLAWISGDSGG